MMALWLWACANSVVEMNSHQQSCRLDSSVLLVQICRDSRSCSLDWTCGQTQLAGW